MDRSEHIEWCKNRALEYLDSGDLENAHASMMSNITKHPETETHAGIELGMMLLFGGFLSTHQQMREWIIGFN